MPVTLKQIAKFTGFSPATVSLALNNRRINQETKAKVLKAAEMLNYEPSAIARALRMNKNYTIGLACENPKLELVTAVVQTAKARGYHIMSQQFREYDIGEERAAYQSLLSQRVDGALIWPSESGLDYGPIIEDFRQHGIPLVMIDRNIPSINVPCFCCDNRRGMKMAWLHLWNIGRRPIVYVDFDTDVSSVQARREGIRDAYLQLGARWNDEYHVKVLTRNGLNQDLLRRAFEIAKGGGAVLAAGDHIAFAAIRLNIEKMKFAMPEEVALVGFEDEVTWLKERVGRITSPPLTTVRMHFDEIGQKATEFLIDVVEKKDLNGSFGNNTVFLVEPQLVVRRSCGGKPGIYGLNEKDEIRFLGEEEEL